MNKDIFEGSCLSVYFWGSTSCLKSFGVAKCSAEKIATYFNQFQESIFKRLEGSWAVAILEKSKNQWMLARDCFGLEPLYFCFDYNNQLKFSQRIKDLSVGKELNFNKIIAYLSPGTSEYPVYSTETYYKRVFNVLPGQYLKIVDKDISSHIYWRPKTLEYADLNKSYFFEEFRSFLFQSVETGTSEFSNVASHLSGGLDSSTLGIIYAKKRSLTTYYLDVENEDSNDKYYSDFVAAQIHSSHYVIKPKTNIYETLFELSTEFGAPENFILPNTSNFAISEHAKALGIDAVITGHDGDTIIGHGYEYFAEIEKNDDWETLNVLLNQRALNRENWDEISDWKQLSTQDKTKTYKNNYTNQRLSQYLKNGEVQEIQNLLKNARKHFGYTPLSYLNYLAERISEKLFYNPKHSNLFTLRSTPNLEKNWDIRDLYTLENIPAIEQLKASTNKQFIEIHEEYHAIGRIFDHKYLFPFMDRKLLELSMSVPDRIKFGNGKTRALLREGLKNDLPKELLERRGKTEFSHYIISSCINLWQENKDRFLTNDLLWNFVDKPTFLKLMKFVQNPKIPNFHKKSLVGKLNRIMYLAIWMDTLKK